MGVYKCPACETRDAEEGVYGRTDLGEGAIVDWHRAPFLKSDPSLLFSDLNIDVPWKNLVDIVNFPTGPRKLGQPRLVLHGPAERHGRQLLLSGPGSADQARAHVRVRQWYKEADRGAAVRVARSKLLRFGAYKPVPGRRRPRELAY